MATVCKGCGTRPEDWERNPNAFIATYTQCPGCLRLEEDHDNVPDGMKGVHHDLVPEEEGIRRTEAMGERRVVDDADVDYDDPDNELRRFARDARIAAEAAQTPADAPDHVPVTT